MEESESHAPHPAGEESMIAEKDDIAKNNDIAEDMPAGNQINLGNAEERMDLTSTEAKTHAIYTKFISWVAPSILQDTDIFGESTAMEVCKRLGMNDTILANHVQAEMEKLRLKVITLHRMNQLGISPIYFKQISEAMYSYDDTGLLSLYLKVSEYAKVLEIMEKIVSELGMDKRIMSRAQAILINNIGILQTLPSVVAATLISMAVITFHLKCTYTLVDIAKASHIAESTIYYNIQKLMEFKRIPRKEYPNFFEVESLVFSFKGFFLTNKKVPTALLREYEGVQSRFRTHILECVKSGMLNSIRFSGRFLKLQEFFEANQLRLSGSNFITGNYVSPTDSMEYSLTKKGREQLELSLSFYRKLEDITKFRDDCVEEWMVWADSKQNDSLDNQFHPSQSEIDRGADGMEGR